MNRDPQNELVLLFDEVETHLHPKWQRVVLPALLSVINDLRTEGRAQIIAATHAPLVMASVEPIFDESLDRVFHLEVKDGKAVIEEIPWAKQGDAVAWLASDVFGLQEARSVDAERAIEAALSFMRGDRGDLPPNLTSREAIQTELERVLPGHDPFWPRWIARTNEEFSRHDAHFG